MFCVYVWMIRSVRMPQPSLPNPLLPPPPTPTKPPKKKKQFGRFFAGIATSLLFSSFEAWMVCEHNKRGFEGAWLSETFGYLTLGNGFVAGEQLFSRS